MGFRTNGAGAVACMTVVGLLVAVSAVGQPLGQFRWQQQPYCNVITLNVVQAANVFHLDGYDDQCGDAAPRAAVVGTAFLNTDGTVGMGLTIVTAPAGTPLHLSATLNPVSIDGGWRDTSGNTGAFVFTPGAPLPGNGRPAPRSVFPAGLSLEGTTITNVGAPSASTDAANRGYVDGVAATKADAGAVNLVVPLANAGYTGALPAAQVTLGQTTFTIPAERHLKIDMLVTGGLTCTTASQAFWWIELDGAPVTSSVKVYGKQFSTFDITGFPPLPMTGITASPVAAGEHTVRVRGGCASGTTGVNTNILFTGSVTMLDAAYGSRAAAVADLAPPADSAAPCLVRVAADGSERRACP